MGSQRLGRQKRIQVLHYISIITFMLSLILIVYSAVQIISSRMEVKSSLEKWDNMILAKSSTEFKKDDSENKQNIISTGNNNINQDRTDKTEDIIENPLVGAMGVLSILGMDVRAAIFEGTETEQLKKGIGHYKGTAFLGEAGNCVLTGHNDTVFRNLGKLKNGDTILIEMKANTYKYKVTGVKIVDQSDGSVLTQGNERILTLITCYPFAYIGLSSERYIVTAKLEMPVKQK